MPAQKLRKVLGKGRARQHHIATRLGGFLLQIALHVRQEADDGGSLFQLALQPGDGGERLGGDVVEIKNNERRLVVAVVAHAFQQVLVAFDKLDLDVKLARGFLDLGQEKQVV